MTLQQQKLGLKIRERAMPTRHSVKFQPKSVKKWVDGLPMANIGETSRLVYDVLCQSNTLYWDEGERFKSLQIIGRLTEYICDCLKKHFVGHSVALSEKQRKIAALAQALQTEMAIGYKTIVEDIVSGDSRKIDSKVNISAIYHAMYYLSQVLIRSYQLYTPTPSGLWLELHTLHQFAEINVLVNEKISDKNNDYPVTIDRLYKQVLLLALANPYQLRQQKIPVIFQAIAPHALDCSIHNHSVEDGHFLLMRKDDLPPQISHEDNTEKLKGRYYLNLSKIVSKLQHVLRSPSKESLEPSLHGLAEIDNVTIKHLLKAWSQHSNRAFARSEGKNMLDVAVGLSATHFLLEDSMPKDEQALSNNGKDISSMTGSLANATFDEEDVEGSLYLNPAARNDNKKFDLWAEMHKNPNLANLSDEDPRKTAFRSGKNVRYQFSRASVVNTSPGGYCLAFKGEIPQHIQTGEVVGIVDAQGLTEIKSWSIGTIRWMKRTTKNAIEVGVQLLAPNARSVNSQIKSSQTDQKSFQRSLLLPALKGIGQPATLITMPMPYKVKQKVRVKDNGHQYEAQLTKLIAATPSYKQFHFEVTQTYETEKPKVSQKPKRPPDSESFDSIWDLI